MGEQKVRVGVRVRPFLPNEKAASGECKKHLKCILPGQIVVKDKAFEYDHVFPENISQGQLYSLTAGPMLDSFLEGYNVTILAYGQTGSGKTYTMGSDTNKGLDAPGVDGGVNPQQGLIPRFIGDLFERLRSRRDGNFKVKASFLEIYDEQVYDLLEEGDGVRVGSTRTRVALPVRDRGGGAGGMHVPGLTELDMNNKEDTMFVLRKGIENRTTGSTLMNQVSSRSHAIFTVTLEQELPAAAEGEEGGEDADDRVPLISKLTFADLAGSERAKKTGAEGERMREGQQINLGLLALGKVISALTSEDGKPRHVPYRESKLTRLLQDALGGNSQTLFLACVSPAESSREETSSTLHYARRARNIRNKPVKNTDLGKEELRGLRHATHFLRAELVRHMFGASPGRVEEMMENAEVKTFLEELGGRLNGHLRRIGVESMDGVALLARAHGPATPGGLVLASPMLQGRDPARRTSMFDDANGGEGAAGVERRLLFGAEAMEGGGAVPRGEVGGDPKKDLELIAQIEEITRKERQQFQEELEEKRKQEEEMGTLESELGEIDQKLEIKENLVQELRKTLESYHEMRAKYDALLKETEAKEAEKVELQEQLQKAVEAEGRKEAGAPEAVGKLRQRLRTVTEQLEKLRSDKDRHQKAHKINKQQQEVYQRNLEEVKKLKAAKVELMRQQKQKSKEHEAKLKRLCTDKAQLSRERSQLQRGMGQLQAANRTQKNMLERKDKAILRANKAVKALEARINGLISERKARARTQQRGGVRGREMGARAVEQVSEASVESVNAVMAMLEGHMASRVQVCECERQLIAKTEEMEAVRQEMAAKAAELGRMEGQDDIDALIREMEDRQQALELDMELRAADIEDLQRQVDKGPSTTETEASRSVANLKPAEAQMVVLRLMDKAVDAMDKGQELREQADRARCEREGLVMQVAEAEKKCVEMTEGYERRLLEVKKHLGLDLLNNISTAGDDLTTGNQLQCVLDENVELGKRVEELESELKDAKRGLQIYKEAAESSRQDHEMLRTIMTTYSDSHMEEQERCVRERLTRLAELWKELGLEEAKRAAHEAKVKNAQAELCVKLEGEARSMISSARRSVDSLQKKLEALDHVLSSSYQQQASAATRLSLLKYEAQLRALYGEAYRTFDARRERALKLDVEARQLRAVVGADHGHGKDEGNCAELDQLRQLASVLQTQGGPEALGAMGQGALGEQALVNWEAGMKGLLRRKAVLGEELQGIVDRTHALLEAGGWGGAAALLGAVRQALAREQAGKTSMAGKLEDSMLERVCEACATGGEASVTGLAPAGLQKAYTAAKFVAGVVEECEELTKEVRTACAAVQTAVEQATSTMIQLPPFPNLGEGGGMSKQSVEAFKAALEGSLAAVQEAQGMARQGLEKLHKDLLEVTGRPVVEPPETDSMTVSVAPAEAVLASALDVARARLDLQGWVKPLLEDVRATLLGFQTAVNELRSTSGRLGQLTQRREALRKVKRLEADILKMEDQGQQFESGPAGDRNRLTQRKTSSTFVLEQEKSRREHQRRLGKLYKELASELRELEASAKEAFDPTLLDERVRASLQKEGGGWAGGRTELLHLSSNPRGGSRGSSPTDFDPAAPPQAPASQSPTPDADAPLTPPGGSGSGMPFDHVLGGPTPGNAKGAGVMSLNRLMGAGVPGMKHILKGGATQKAAGQGGAGGENQENSTPNTSRGEAKVE